jgi:hypothetical protein
MMSEAQAEEAQWLSYIEPHRTAPTPSRQQHC